MRELKNAPDFIIIGAQRCGTTSLYNHLVRDPRIASALQKEVHFFDINYGKGIDWYRSQFPSLDRRNLITGEASPYYLFHPHAPGRISNTMPQVRLVVLLRNPVDRAYSHYHHEVRRGVETLSFKEALEKEEERLRGEMERMLEDKNYYSFNHQHYSYLSRGHYVDQLKQWAAIFPQEQILVIRSEDLYEGPSPVIKRVMKFLNPTIWDHKTGFKRLARSLKALGRKRNGFKNYNNGQYVSMDRTLRRDLIDYFDPHNQRLYEYLGVNFDWDR